MTTRAKLFGTRTTEKKYEVSYLSSKWVKKDLNKPPELQEERIKFPRVFDNKKDAEKLLKNFKKSSKPQIMGL